MITFTTGNIFDADVEALVNPVNCVGVMGAGLAKGFKERWPDYFDDYQAACKRNAVRLGWVAISDVSDGLRCVNWIVSFPTKQHWRDRSSLGAVAFGLGTLAGAIRNWHLVWGVSLRNIAIPALGCGLGGLNWADVKPCFEFFEGAVGDTNIIVYEPHAASY